MDLWKVLRLVSLVQLKLISKTDRTRFPKWGRLPLPFEWVLKFQMLTASPSHRNEGLLSPSLQFQLLQKSTWKDGCESLKKKIKGRNTPHLSLQSFFSCLLCTLSLSWQWCRKKKVDFWQNTKGQDVSVADGKLSTPRIGTACTAFSRSHPADNHLLFLQPAPR